MKTERYSDQCGMRWRNEWASLCQPSACLMLRRWKNHVILCVCWKNDQIAPLDFSQPDRLKMISLSFRISTNQPHYLADQVTQMYKCCTSHITTKESWPHLYELCYRGALRLDCLLYSMSHPHLNDVYGVYTIEVGLTGCGLQTEHRKHLLDLLIA